MIEAIKSDLKEIWAKLKRDYKAGYPFAWACDWTGRHHTYKDIYKGDHRKFGCPRCGVETITAHAVIPGAEGRVLR